jgi:hypothetical protein
MEPAQNPESLSYGHLEKLLEENLKVARDNHKILRRMERNALIGFVAKIIIWLIVLGVPIFFLSTYLGPIMEAVQGTGTSTPSGVFGLPSAEQLQEIINTYKAQTR